MRESEEVFDDRCRDLMSRCDPSIRALSPDGFLDFQSFAIRSTASLATSEIFAARNS